MKYFNGSNYPESAKSAENDFLHILLADNGTFTVSHKESGRVFFEMPTLLIGKDDTYTCARAVASEKSRSAETASFNTLLSASLLSPDLENPCTVHTKALLSMLLCDKSERLTFSLRYQPGNYEVILRFPTGIYCPTVTDNSTLDEKKAFFADITPKITLTDDEGQSFRLSATCEQVEFTVTEDGNIDARLPSIAPVNGETCQGVGFEISFS